MGLFTPEDINYDETTRMTGFNRYKQMLSFHAEEWLKLNLITCVGLLPFGFFASYAVLSNSSLIMLFGGTLGGAIFGPFLAALYDSIMRGLMDAPGNWWHNYKKAFKQNLSESILPGAILGLLTGMLIFMTHLFFMANVSPTKGTIALYFFIIVMLLIINMLYWPQMVLFKQTLLMRTQNMLLFTAKYLWKVLLACLLQLIWLAVLVLFSPFTLILIPFLGFWFIIFVSELIIYEPLNQELHIEELYDITWNNPDIE